MFYLLAIISGIWSLSRIADSDFHQAGYLLAATAIFAIAGFVIERNDEDD